MGCTQKGLEFKYTPRKYKHIHARASSVNLSSSSSRNCAHVESDSQYRTTAYGWVILFAAGENHLPLANAAVLQLPEGPPTKHVLVTTFTDYTAQMPANSRFEQLLEKQPAHAPALIWHFRNFPQCSFLPLR
jgi:hypothetical protein